MSDQHDTSQLIGREDELSQLLMCLSSEANVLIEGPVGVGKTHLALKASTVLDLPFIRVDGDGRYSEGKLVGWFDPPLVMKSGYERENFISGPLTRAMESGGLLFINELNRMPEGVQNILLPVMDEGILEIPKVGTIRASEGFCIVATQNPSEFVATSPISEALFDRFELIVLDHPSEDAERKIIQSKAENIPTDILGFAVKLMRLTRNSTAIRRGASLRAAISLCRVAEKAEITSLETDENKNELIKTAILTYSSRIEPVEHNKNRAIELVDELSRKILFGDTSQKKK